MKFNNSRGDVAPPAPLPTPICLFTIRWGERGNEWFIAATTYLDTGATTHFSRFFTFCDAMHCIQQIAKKSHWNTISFISARIAVHKTPLLRTHGQYRSLKGDSKAGGGVSWKDLSEQELKFINLASCFVNRHCIKKDRHPQACKSIPFRHVPNFKYVGQECNDKFVTGAEQNDQESQNLTSHPDRKSDELHTSDKQENARCDDKRQEGVANYAEALRVSHLSTKDTRQKENQ